MRPTFREHFLLLSLITLNYEAPFWVPGALSLVIKRPGREADRSPPSSAEVMTWCSIKAQGQLYLLPYYAVFSSLLLLPPFMSIFSLDLPVLMHSQSVLFS
jgi:hypothetical protein